MQIIALSLSCCPNGEVGFILAYADGGGVLEDLFVAYRCEDGKVEGYYFAEFGRRHADVDVVYHCLFALDFAGNLGL